MVTLTKKKENRCDYVQSLDDFMYLKKKNTHTQAEVKRFNKTIKNPKEPI